MTKNEREQIERIKADLDGAWDFKALSYDIAGVLNAHLQINRLFEASQKKKMYPSIAD